MTEFEAEMEKLAKEYSSFKLKWSQSGERFTVEEHAQGIGMATSEHKVKGFRRGAKAALRSKLVRDLVQELERLNDMMPGLRSVDEALEAYEKEIGE